MLQLPEEADRQTSVDGTVKHLYRLQDGQMVESVLMVFDYGYSACLSTQVGCNMGCTFCASGLLKNFPKGIDVNCHGLSTFRNYYKEIIAYMTYPSKAKSPI